MRYERTQTRTTLNTASYTQNNHTARQGKLCSTVTEMIFQVSGFNFGIEISVLDLAVKSIRSCPMMLWCSGIQTNNTSICSFAKL